MGASESRTQCTRRRSRFQVGDRVTTLGRRASWFGTIVGHSGPGAYLVQVDNRGPRAEYVVLHSRHLRRLGPAATTSVVFDASGPRTQSFRGHQRGRCEGPARLRCHSVPRGGSSDPQPSHSAPPTHSPLDCGPREASTAPQHQARGPVGSQDLPPAYALVGDAVYVGQEVAPPPYQFSVA